MKLSSTVIQNNSSLTDVESLALSIDDAIGEVVEKHAKNQFEAWRRVLGIILVGAGIVAAAGYWSVGMWLWLAGLCVIGVGVFMAARVDDGDPDVLVTGARKRYWTAYAFPRAEGTLLFDATDVIEKSTFDLDQLDDPKTLRRAHDELAEMNSFPTVMPREDNVEERIEQHLEGIHAELMDTNTITLEAPVIKDTHSIVRGLETIDEAMTDGHADLNTAYDMDEAAEIVEAIEDLEQLAFDNDPGEQLRELKCGADDTVTRVVETQSDAIEQLNDHIETAGDLLATTSYNFYCPICQIDDVESPLEASLVDGTEWYCNTCTQTFKEGIVVPKHRMKDELIEDVWDQLWIEKDDERRRIYERIEDQKEELAEREYEQRREEIRTTTDRIKDRRAKLRDLQTKANAGRGKVDEIGSLMVKYRGLAETRKNEFRDEVNRKAEMIERETQRVIEETRDIDQQRLEEAEQQARANARVIEAEQERRHREQLAMQQTIAETAHENALANKAAAVASHEVAGDVKRQNVELESIADHKKKEFLLETRGSVSPVKMINKMHMKKGAIRGFTPVKQN